MTMPSVLQADAPEHALAGDLQRAPAEPHGGRDAVDAVDGDHAVGGLGGDRRARRAHRDADVGQRQRGRVVDAVADHHDRPHAGRVADRAHDLELLLGRAVGVDAVDADALGDRLARRTRGRR